MGIFDNNSTTEEEAKIIAGSLVKITKNTFDKIKVSYSQGVQMFWNNPKATPQEIADALGPDSSEVFSLHYKLGELIASVDPSFLEERVQLIGNFVQNEDGTVTIVEETE
tara:strand:+ start:1508 stop:1837 length:330 start_codon:yes stop_codon:yes gene_type:complete